MPDPADSPKCDRTVRILMVDDHALLRGALARTLSNEPDLVIVGECSSVDEALDIVADRPVDVVLLDINLGTEQGGSFVTRSRAAGYSGKVLVVTAGVSDREATWLMNRGCSGIFRKTEPVQTLVSRVRQIVLQTGVEAPAIQHRPNSNELAQGIRKPLTRREALVLKFVCQGLANKEIAQKMGVSEHSVKSFIQQLFLKTGGRSRAHLVALAIEQYWDQLENKDSDDPEQTPASP